MEKNISWENRKFSILKKIIIAPLITLFIWSSVLEPLGMTWSLVKIPVGINNVFISLLVLLGAYRLTSYVIKI